MSDRRNAYVGALAVVFVAALAPMAAAQPRAVVELFTSQGCSSCPPADRLLSELSKEPDVVALSLPINYWDYLGWKDTLADARHNMRQKAYSQARGDREVYTPQIVVNGVVQAPGSDRAAIEQAIKQSRGDADVLSVPIKLSIDKDMVTVKASASEAEARTAEVWLCPLTRSVQVHIGRGENRDKTVTYTNVVRDWIKLGTWAGAEATWRVPISRLKSEDADAFAVLIQGGTPDQPGAVFGAAAAGLH
jgi:hypothetical protein